MLLHRFHILYISAIVTATTAYVDVLRPIRQIFSLVGTCFCLPGLSQYLSKAQGHSTEHQ